ncbi:type IVB secretion system protein IcmH/DotU [Thalassomonas actiniarum]|uniref:DotU family type IV/VI secretion system protein n=1 Tax=Thalassomonas actiniarum TaxID=485447 RepID=A0AAE9YR57_9GAMM|nr:type IVB secretion system protein IcmH/DotU [Thalassomonas actiniarum]WDD99162.1 DotU family type IV/VI secretion system protein [Thalassomonas actiniarum]
MAEFTQPEQEPVTVPIDFSDTVLREELHFDYADNPLYNVSVPLLSVILTLPRLPKPENIEQFRQQLKRDVVALSEAGKKLDYPSAVIDKLCCLHCIVIDEFIIHGLWGYDAGWENNTLLSELFSMKNGGELFFTVAEKAMLQPAKMADLLEIIYVFLQMGFKGRYRSRQTDRLGLIIKEIAGAIKVKINKANVLIEDIPQVKYRSLRSGVHYFSLTLLIFFLLGLATAFVDYWYEQNYPLRAAAFLDLDKLTSRYVLNAKSEDIVYVSTNEDVHAIHNLTAPHSEREKAPAVPVEQSTPEKTVPQAIAPEKIPVKKLPQKVVPEPATPPPVSAAITGSVEPVPGDKVQEQSPVVSAYRVQLASFSSKKNAEKYLPRFQASVYPVGLMAVGKYFILYSNADNWQAVKQQQSYFDNEYQLAVSVIATKKAEPAL